MRYLFINFLGALALFDYEALPSIERNLRRMMQEKKQEVARTHDALTDTEQHLAEGLHALLTREDKARPFAKSQALLLGGDQDPSSFAEIDSDNNATEDSDSEDPYVASEKEFQQVANIADEMINSTTIEHKMNLKAGEEYLKKHGKTAGYPLSKLVAGKFTNFSEEADRELDMLTNPNETAADLAKMAKEVLPDVPASLVDEAPANASSSDIDRMEVKKTNDDLDALTAQFAAEDGVADPSQDGSDGDEPPDMGNAVADAIRETPEDPPGIGDNTPETRPHPSSFIEEEEKATSDAKDAAGAAKGAAAAGKGKKLLHGDAKQDEEAEKQTQDMLRSVHEELGRMEAHTKQGLAKMNAAWDELAHSSGPLGGTGPAPGVYRPAEEPAGGSDNSFNLDLGDPSSFLEVGSHENVFQAMQAKLQILKQKTRAQIEKIRAKHESDDFLGSSFLQTGENDVKAGDSVTQGFDALQANLRNLTEFTKHSFLKLNSYMENGDGPAGSSLAEEKVVDPKLERIYQNWDQEAAKVKAQLMSDDVPEENHPSSFIELGSRRIELIDAAARRDALLQKAAVLSAKVDQEEAELNQASWTHPTAFLEGIANKVFEGTTAILGSDLRPGSGAKGANKDLSSLAELMPEGF